MLITLQSEECVMARSKSSGAAVKRKKRATIGASEKENYRDIARGLKDYSDSFPFSGVQIKLTLVLPCETFVLYRLAGKSYDKIAEIVGLSKFAVFKLAAAYQSMDPPFGGFEPLQINYLKKQLQAGRSLKDIAAELNGALDDIQGIPFEDRVPNGGSASSPEKETASSDEWWDNEAAGKTKGRKKKGAEPDRERLFEVPVQSFDSPEPKDTVTLRISEQGLKYYISDMKIDAVPEKSLTGIINFRSGKKELPQNSSDVNYTLWKNIAAYYQENELTIRNYVHQQVFPPELVALYRLSGYSWEDIVNTVPEKYRKLLSLSGKRLYTLQKLSYRKNPKYRVIPPEELHELLTDGTSANDIAASAIEEISNKYMDSLTGFTVRLEYRFCRAKKFTAKITPEGIENYLSDLSKPETGGKKRGRPKKEKAETAESDLFVTAAERDSSPLEDKAESAEPELPEAETKKSRKTKKEKAETAETDLSATAPKSRKGTRKDTSEPVQPEAEAKKRGRPRKKKEEPVTAGAVQSPGRKARKAADNTAAAAAGPEHVETSTKKRGRPRKKKEESAE